MDSFLRDWFHGCAFSPEAVREAVPGWLRTGSASASSTGRHYAPNDSPKLRSKLFGALTLVLGVATAFGNNSLLLWPRNFASLSARIIWSSCSRTPEVLMNRLLSTTLVSVFLAATSASMAIAQTAANANAPSASSPGHRNMDRAFSRPTERVEARLAYVRTALKITDAQQSQWDAYAIVVRRNAQDMEQRLKSMRSGEPGHANRERTNAIERLERMQSRLADAVTRINQLLAVEKPLYAVLSPEQQQVADAVLNQHLQSMGRHSRHGRGGFDRG